MKTLLFVFLLISLLLVSCSETFSPQQATKKGEIFSLNESPPEKTIEIPRIINLSGGMKEYSPKGLGNIFCDFNYDFDCVEISRTSDHINFVILRRDDTLFQTTENISLLTYSVNFKFRDKSGWHEECNLPVLLTDGELVHEDSMLIFSEKHYRKFTLTCNDPEINNMKSFTAVVTITIGELPGNKIKKVTGTMRYTSI